MTLFWEKQPLNQQVARALRGPTRRHNTPVDGHRFVFDDLRELWCAGETQVVLTHDQDPVWQYWADTPDRGWRLVSVHATRQAAQEVAVEQTPETPVIAPGTYVLARFAESRPWMRIQVSTDQCAADIQSIYVRLGAEVKTEVVGDAA